MTEKEFIRAVANVTGYSNDHICEVLQVAVAVIGEVLAQQGDESVAVPRLGKFKPSVRTVRRVRDPSTAEDIPVLVRRIVLFSPSKRLRAVVGGRGNPCWASLLP